MERYLCVHGHFYQPPRENPWLEAVELQDSAYPYHDWNARVTAECYAPNATARILDGEGRIVKIVNNYAKMSFNFGPTLLAWLESERPDVYEAVLAADRESRERFGGHGSALAQAYNHMIMPLANRRDRYTQALWGVKDFEHRFGRSPEGMWLPETAVDTETLEVVAELGLQFVVLAPHQAGRVRPVGGRAWKDVSGARIDPSRAYTARLPSGRSTSLFFYDGPISRAVAFEGLLSSGEAFAERLASGFSDERDWPQLVHVATDGESYGHHHRHGEMALSYALDYIEREQLARLTNYGEFLERHPPTHEVQLVEPTSWSCAHGVERWRSDCGCNSGMHRGWHQGWRAPLRDALDWLREEIAGPYETRGGELLRDPWAARDDYVSVVLDRSPAQVDAFLARYAARELSEADKTNAIKLLELQRHAMLMYTSCGWFFDELSGIETVQVIQYASRAIQLGEELFGRDLEAPFLERLEEAKSNIGEHGDGRQVYEKFVKPATVDLAKVCAHYAISSLFDSYDERARVYSYQIDREQYEVKEAGHAKLALGQARVTSEVTRESATLNFGVLHFGDHNVNGGVREFLGQRAYRTLRQQASKAFQQADFPEVLRVLDRYFGASTYSLRSLFRDEQRRVLDEIVGVTAAEVEGADRQFVEHHVPLMRFLGEIGIPLPRAFRAASESVLNSDLRSLLERDEADLERTRELLDEARALRLDLDAEGLAYALELTLQRLAEQLRAAPADLTAVERLDDATTVASELSFEVDLSKAQNAYYAVLHSTYPEMRSRAERGDGQARAWAGRFVGLGERLAVRVE